MSSTFLSYPWALTKRGFTSLTGRVSTLEAKNVRSTRFVILAGPATSGAITLPAGSSVVLDDFGGTVDAIISAVDSGRPTFAEIYSAAGAVVASTFDSAGNYSLSSAPAAWPVALIFRVSQPFIQYDATSGDLIGDFYLFSKPLASEVSYDNTSSGLTADNVQAALDEVGNTAAVSASPGFTWGGSGTKNAGTYLLNDTVPSNLSGRSVPLASGVISSVFVALSEAGTVELVIQKRSGGSFVTIGSIALTAERVKIDATLNAAVTYGDELAVKIESGSCKDPIVGIVIKGAAS